MTKISSFTVYEDLSCVDSIEEYREYPEFQKTVTHFRNEAVKLIDLSEYRAELYVQLLEIIENEEKSNCLRKSQFTAILAIMEHILNGESLNGLIKLPTGAGKTRLFSDVIKSLEQPSLILVPRKNLRKQTGEYFPGAYVIGENGDTVTDSAKKILRKIEKDKDENPVVVITYQSFGILKKSPKLFNKLSDLVKVVIRDEAHRSLGDKTIEALDEFMSFENEEEKEAKQEQDEHLLSSEYDFAETKEKLELLFTATPNLLNKSVRDSYEEIFALRIQELVEEGELFGPTFRQTNEVSISMGEENYNQTNLDNLGYANFVDENGTPVHELIIQEYLDLKEEKGGYMPGVAFCRTIEHAEAIKGELEKQGLRAVRVTSSNAKYDKGVKEEDAQEMLENNELDIVVTVTKVSEGWDVPTLRAALNFAPILSQAKYLQGIGRVFRTIDLGVESESGLSAKDGAYVIEPKFWNVSGYTGDIELGESEARQSEGGIERGKNEEETIDRISGIIHLMKSGEFDEGFLEGEYGDLSEYKDGFTSLRDYEEYALSEEGLKNLKKGGILVNIESKEVDLSEIKSPIYGKYKFGGIGAVSGLKNLYNCFSEEQQEKINGYDGKDLISSKEEASQILQQLFENMGYKVKLSKKITLKTLEDYKNCILSEKGLKSLENAGIILDNEKKVVDLTSMISPQNEKFNFGKDNAGSFFKMLYHCFSEEQQAKIEGYNGRKTIGSIKIAEQVLQVFFEYIGYEVKVKQKLILETLEDYKEYILNGKGKEELQEGKIEINIKTKEVDLSDVGMSNSFYLGKIKAINGLKKLYDCFSEEQKENIKSFSGKTRTVTGKKQVVEILGLFFSEIGFKIKKGNNLKLEKLEDYEEYILSDEGLNELKNAGVKIDIENRIIDLSKIIRPSDPKFKIWRTLAMNGLRTLYLSFGSKQREKVKSFDSEKKQLTSKKQAKEILQVFFEKMGFEVRDLKVKALKTFDEFKNYISSDEGKNDLKDAGIKFDDKNKKVDISNFSKLTDFNFGKKSSRAGLTALYKSFDEQTKQKVKGYDSKKRVEAVQVAKVVLKVFFEELGYEILDSSLENYEDYKEYFLSKEGQKDFKEAGLLINEDDKIVDFSNIKTPYDFYINNDSANIGLRDFLKLFPKDLKQKVSSCDGTKKITSKKQVIDIFKIFFEDLGYNVIGLNERLKSINDYQDYFLSEKGIKEVQKFGIKINKADKIVDLKDLLSPKNKKFKLKNIGGQTVLFSIYNLFSRSEQEQIEGNIERSSITKEIGINILQVFFEKIGYSVNLGNQLKLETLEDYKKYILTQQGIEELEIFGLTIDQNKNEVNLSGIKAVKNYELGKEDLRSVLKKIYDLFSSEQKIMVKGYKGKGRVISTKYAINILQVFFESLGYNVDVGDTPMVEVLSDYENYIFRGRGRNNLGKAGVVFNEDDKKVDLSDIISPSVEEFQFGGMRANSGLKNLYNYFTEEQKISVEDYNGGKKMNKEQAQQILQIFFEDIGYEVILKKNLI